MSADHNLHKGFQESSVQGTLIYKLTKEIESNLNNDQFGVNSLAQAVGMSRSSLHRQLHKHLDISTSQFIREYRLKRALEILRQEDITASEVAYRVGFSSATYFNTCFHNFYGYTPGEVKSRKNNEVEKLDGHPNSEKARNLSANPEISKVKKGHRKKIAFSSALLVVVILSAILFLYNAKTKDNNETQVMGKIIDEKSIAVLPFKNWTGDPNLEYISDGMTDAVISRLTKISAIDKVIPFTSTIKYKETNKSTEEIANELGVANLIQGNLQISGNQIKINLQMIDSRSNDHLWSEEYVRDWKVDEIFKMQTEVVEGIAANMSAVITDNELAYVKNIPTKSKQAYSSYLQAEFQRYKANEATFTLAMPLYEKAIAIDSNFVEAYLGLASIWNSGGMVWGIYNEQLAWRNAKGLLEKALEIDPTNQEVEEELYTGYFYYDWKFERAEQFYRTKSKGSFYVNTPIINIDFAIKTGRYQEAIKTIDKQLLRDPSLIGILFCRKAEALMFLGNMDEAMDLLNNTAIPYCDNRSYLRESAKQYFYLGKYEKSKVQLDKILTQFPDYPPILMWLNAVYAQMDGNSKEADQYLAELQNKYNEGSSGSPGWFIALYYCTLKDYENAFKWLQKSYERHEVEMTWLREEPLLAPLRNDPRYKDLYEKVGFSSIGLPIKTSSEIYSSK